MDRKAETMRVRRSVLPGQKEKAVVANFKVIPKVKKKCTETTGLRKKSCILYVLS